MRKEYSSEYKAAVVLEILREEKSLKEIAGERMVHPNMLGRWKTEALKNLHTIFENKKGEERKVHEVQIQELYAQIGELSSKLAWLKKKSGIDV